MYLFENLNNKEEGIYKVLANDDKEETNMDSNRSNKLLWIIARDEKTVKSLCYC